MRGFKAFAAASVVAFTFSASAACAQGVTRIAATSNEAPSHASSTATTGLVNVIGGGDLGNEPQLSNAPNLGGNDYKIDDSSNGGSGIAVTNLLTLLVGAGTVFPYIDGTSIANRTINLDQGTTINFAADILRFVNIADQSTTLAFNDVKEPKAGIFSADRDAALVSNALPTLPSVPEPVSAALLVVGMTVVGVAARRRRLRRR